MCDVYIRSSSRDLPELDLHCPDFALSNLALSYLLHRQCILNSNISSRTLLPTTCKISRS